MRRIASTFAIRVVQRPRIHAGDAPVLRHHRRVVARHRRLAAAADRQAVGTQAGRLHQDVHPLGSDPVNNPNSQYWFTDDWDTVPLKAWAEARAGGPPYDWGTGLGVSHTKGPEYAFTQVTVPGGKSSGSS